MISSRMGFTFAQNDQILITLEYPLLLVAIWTSALLSVVLRLEHLKIFPPLLAVAWALSHYLAQVDSWLGGNSQKSASYSLYCMN